MQGAHKAFLIYKKGHRKYRENQLPWRKRKLEKHLRRTQATDKESRKKQHVNPRKQLMTYKRPPFSISRDTAPTKSNGPQKLVHTQKGIGSKTEGSKEPHLRNNV